MPRRCYHAAHQRLYTTYYSKRNNPWICFLHPAKLAGVSSSTAILTAILAITPAIILTVILAATSTVSTSTAILPIIVVSRLYSPTGLQGD
ncbi:hypothetical protein V496_00430 [Pseudogymnoascus sp. VKM F-4515 (FW-2607)]|nr:hypothetical protein V496_00430 [Pseudogymnoascus sp. VKM F-4515 (FW-2607)]